jgi:hypothetical protein
VKFFKSSNLPILSLLTPFLQNYYKISILHSFLLPTIKLIILFLLKKLVGTSILKIELKIMSREEEGSKDPSSPFKEKEKEGKGRSKAWWPKEGEEEGSHIWRSMEGEEERVHIRRSMEGEGEGSKAWWPTKREGEGSHAWRPMEGEGEGSQAWRPMEGEGKGSHIW